MNAGSGVNVTEPPQQLSSAIRIDGREAESPPAHDRPAPGPDPKLFRPNIHRGGSEPMSEPTYELTPEQQYAMYYDDGPGRQPAPMTEPEQQPTSDDQPPQYEDFYPDSPAPTMTDEDRVAYESYYPNIHGTPDRKRGTNR